MIRKTFFLLVQTHLKTLRWFYNLLDSVSLCSKNKNGLWFERSPVRNFETATKNVKPVLLLPPIVRFLTGRSREHVTLLNVFILAGVFLFQNGVIYSKDTQEIDDNKPHGKIVIGTWIKDLGTKEIVDIQIKNLGPNDRIGSSLLSPDGKKLVFEQRININRERTPEKVELRILDFSNKNERILATTTHYWFYYDWSPDSRYIIFSNLDLKDTYIILNIETMESFELKIPKDQIEDSGRIFWSRDGRWINFHGGDYKGQDWFFRIGLNGNDLTPIVPIPHLASAVLSHDEKFLLFSPIEDNDIYYMNIEKKTIKRLWKTSQEENYILWSPDQKWIGYRVINNRSSTGADFYVRSVRTNKEINLKIPFFATSFSWWMPQTKTPPDCEKIVREMLGEGKKIVTSNE